VACYADDRGAGCVEFGVLLLPARSWLTRRRRKMFCACGAYRSPDLAPLMLLCYGGGCAVQLRLASLVAGARAAFSGVALVL
jgi:hypothetical protein